jgi:hypothetical protein
MVTQRYGNHPGFAGIAIGTAIGKPGFEGGEALQEQWEKP